MERTMSKTFGQLRAGDEVYVIKGCNVEIVKVQRTRVAKYTAFIMFGDTDYALPSTTSVFHNFYKVGDIYCDINDAMRRMQDICAKALHDYREASGALNLLETKKKEL